MAEIRAVRLQPTDFEVLTLDFRLSTKECIQTP
jgi:hypothetical protein